jgi:hypothetical protein
VYAWALTGSVAVLIFAAAAVVAATFAGLAAGAITSAVAGGSLVLGVVVAWFAARACRPRALAPNPPRIGIAGGAAAILFLLAALRQFLCLATGDGDSVVHYNPYNYGDLPLHWTYVSFLAEGAPFWPQNPIFTKVRLGYPIGSDLLATLFTTLGAETGVVFRATGVVASLALLFALWRWAGALAVAAFVFSGGFDLSRLDAGAFLRPDDPELPWKNVLLALFVPQRGFLFALPAGLLLLWSAREKLLRERPGLPSVVEGLLWGAMPLFHIHTFLVYSLVVATWGVARRQVAAMRGSLLVAVPLATFGVWQVTDGFAAARVVWWKPGWMIGAENPLLFLLESFGLLVPLAVVALLRPLPDRKAEERLQLATGLALFVALFFVMLAPWEWDNTKAFVWAVVLLWGPLPAWLEARPTALRTLIVALLLLPGVPAALGGTVASRPLVVFDRTEKNEVCAAMRSVPMTARVATAQAFDHPIGLCGRALVAGYAGHLWSHGLSARPVEVRLQQLMNGYPGWEQAAFDLGASYVFWGRREARAFPGSRRPWARDGALVWRGGSGALYRLPE